MFSPLPSLQFQGIRTQYSVRHQSFFQNVSYHSKQKLSSLTMASHCLPWHTPVSFHLWVRSIPGTSHWWLAYLTQFVKECPYSRCQTVNPSHGWTLPWVSTKHSACPLSVDKHCCCECSETNVSLIPVFHLLDLHCVWNCWVFWQFCSENYHTVLHSSRTTSHFTIKAHTRVRIPPDLS